MRPFALVLAIAIFPASSRAEPPDVLTRSPCGIDIPSPNSKKTISITDGPHTIQVPLTMAYIPAGEFTFGAGLAAKKMRLDAYCIGKFDITNAEYKAFLDATHGRPPSYWSNGTYPKDKANHPVAYVSLTQATAYADWVSSETGWVISIPTAEQWEKAARGPQGFLYPWGNSADASYAAGKLTARYNFNAVLAADVLANRPSDPAVYNNPKSRFFNTKTTIDHIAGLDDSGNPTPLSISSTGAVRGWVNHATYTGFIYTDVFTAINNEGGNTSPVGAYEAGKSSYGCYDMAGNIWNWTTTLITATNGAEKGKTVNEIRGGSWYATGNSCRSTSIGEGRAAAGAYNTVGFRIVMLPPP